MCSLLLFDLLLLLIWRSWQLSVMEYSWDFSHSKTKMLDSATFSQMTVEVGFHLNRSLFFFLTHPTYMSQEQLCGWTMNVIFMNDKSCLPSYPGYFYNFFFFNSTSGSAIHHKISQFPMCCEENIFKQNIFCVKIVILVFHNHKIN